MKSIIETIETDVRMQYENGVLKAVKNIGFNVDKERLTQALVNSRSFYNEGYNDAKNEYKREWIRVKDRLPEEPEIGEDGYIVQKKDVIEPFSAYWDGERWTDSNSYPIDDVIAWQPLPSPYKAGGTDE
jgi:hypothetical protein